MRRYDYLKRRLSDLELNGGDEGVESDVDWESLLEKEKDKIIEGARIILLHRSSDWPPVEIDSDALTGTELRIVEEGIRIVKEHPKLKKCEKRLH